MEKCRKDNAQNPKKRQLSDHKIESPIILRTCEFELVFNDAKNAPKEHSAFPLEADGCTP
ncbi:hypothetical protein Pres01_38500 [Metapseudomonas resinovorans]|nr:hypothetical protein Pres01_38500 [Pseudomonas resinovorans]